MQKHRLLGDRMYQVLMYRDTGHRTFTQIASLIGVSRTRARQLYLKANRKLEQTDHPLFGLSTRALNVCHTLGLKTKSDLSDAIVDGRLDPIGGKVRNLGVGTRDEILVFLTKQTT